jgi:hypothetical protein
MNIIPLPRPGADAQATPDVRPLAWALARIEPQALAVMLPGEDLEECRARRAAGQDILSELLAEYAEVYGEGGGNDGLPVVLGDAVAARWTLGGAA